MSEQEKHTPEPWQVGNYEPNCVFDSYADGPIKIAVMVQSRGPSAECIANARRIVACVNAAEGISTQALEASKDFAAAGIATVKSVEAQRDELAEALRTIAEVCNGSGGDAGWACKHAREALAKVSA